MSFAFIRVPPRSLRELRQSLYRKPGRAVICCMMVGTLALAAPAQTPRPKRKAPTLRALGVLELSTESKVPGRGRLVPIFVLEDGRYFDAGLYKVRPQPMAVEPGTIYEAERSGEPAGLFTVEQAAERERAWFAVGGWVPREFEPAKPAKPVVVKTEDDDTPPVLRKPKPAGQSGSAPASSPKPRERTAEGGPAAGQRPGATQSEAPEAPDPDRPVLRRGKPKMAKQDAAAAIEEFAKSGGSASGKEPERLVAVSDASVPERRPFAFPWLRDEQERLTQEAMGMAQAELAKLLEPPTPKRVAQGGRDTKPKSSPPALEEPRIRAFDLNYDNNPEMVLMARHTEAATGTAPARTYYVTLVAGVAIGGELRSLLASVTDDQRLDSVPRLELIDAVDAEGNGDGELLFRRVGRTRQSHELFRVGMDKLWTLFEGAASPL